MKYDILQLLEDNGIILTTGGHNAAQGWVQMKCPYCQDVSDHLGYNISGGYFSCWICQGHSIKDTITKLLDISRNEVQSLLNQYSERPTVKKQSTIQPENHFITDLPPEAIQMTDKHKNYLIKRGFNPYILEKQYKLLGTNHLGDYKFRIIAPIYYQDILVSYQGRDITDRSDLKYKTCPGNKEARPHKHCLYGLDDVIGDTIIIVEGIIDVWRMGIGVVAIFGLNISIPQLKLLSEFKRRYIMLDSGINEFKRSKELAAKLGAFNGENIIVELEKGDPASLSQEDADDIIEELVI